MTGPPFLAVRDALVGSWIGKRRTAAQEGELVRSRWSVTLGGRALREEWLTAGAGESAAPAAEALFSVTESGPGDFVAAYASGKFAFGESAFAEATWTLTHRWLREPGVAVIHLRFLDADTYEQEVLEVAADGSLRPESLAVMRRERPA